MQAAKETANYGIGYDVSRVPLGADHDTSKRVSGIRLLRKKKVGAATNCDPATVPIFSDWCFRGSGDRENIATRKPFVNPVLASILTKTYKLAIAPPCCTARSNKIGVGLGGLPTQNDTLSPRTAKLPQENETRTETATLTQGVRQSLTSHSIARHFRTLLRVDVHPRRRSAAKCRNWKQPEATLRRHRLTIPLSLCRV